MQRKKDYLELETARDYEACWLKLLDKLYSMQNAGAKRQAILRKAFVKLKFEPGDTWLKFSQRWGEMILDYDNENTLPDERTLFDQLLRKLTPPCRNRVTRVKGMHRRQVHST